jgi:hypothetical protein
MDIKIPTFEEFKKYSGRHNHRLWTEVGDGYICPSCKRNKYQILRWTQISPNSPNSFMDWVAVLHRHHDHSQGYSRVNFGRFIETIICDQCNSAASAVKKKLGIPKNFSFAPGEIGLFIKARPHAKHEVDFKIAQMIYETINLK